MHPGNFECSFDRLRSAVYEKGVVDVSGRDLGQEVGQHTPQRVHQLLGRNARFHSLGADRFYDLRVGPSQVERPVTAQTVDVLVTEHIVEIGPLSAPFRSGIISGFGYGFSIFHPPFIEVVHKICYRLFGNLFGRFLCNVRTLNNFYPALCIVLRFSIITHYNLLNICFMFFFGTLSIPFVTL